MSRRGIGLRQWPSTSEDSDGASERGTTAASTLLAWSPSRATIALGRNLADPTRHDIQSESESDLALLRREADALCRPHAAAIAIEATAAAPAAGDLGVGSVIREHPGGGGGARGPSASSAGGAEDHHHDAGPQTWTRSRTRTRTRSRIRCPPAHHPSRPPHPRNNPPRPRTPPRPAHGCSTAAAAAAAWRASSAPQGQRRAG
jgi:hypothetical protein